MTIQEYETRARTWVFQTSTIVGAASIIAAAVAGGTDATTGMPWVSALVGLVAGGLCAIVLPGQNPTAVVAAAEDVATELVAHRVTLQAATDAAVLVSAAQTAVQTEAKQSLITVPVAVVGVPEVKLAK